MNPTPMNGRQMKELRIRKRYSQVQWGEVLGLSQSQVSEMETDRKDEPVSEEFARRALEAPVLPEKKRRGAPPKEATEPPEAPSAPGPADTPKADEAPPAPPPYPAPLFAAIIAALEAVTRLATSLDDHLSVRARAQAQEQQRQAESAVWTERESPPATPPVSTQALLTPAPPHSKAQLPAGVLSAAVSAGGSAPAAPAPLPTESPTPEHKPPSPSPAPLQRKEPKKSRWGHLRENWKGYALTALGTFCVSYLIFQPQGSGPAHSHVPQQGHTLLRQEERPQPTNEQTPPPREEQRDGGVSEPVTGRPLPKKPFKGQKRGPCDRKLGEIEIYGACYWKLDATQCPATWFEYANDCVKPVPAYSDQPMATDPDDDTHPDKPVPSGEPGPRDH